MAKNNTPTSPVVVRRVDPLLPHIWQIGHEVDGVFRAWAGGSSEEALDRLRGRERGANPPVGAEDRRNHAPPDPL